MAIDPRTALDELIQALTEHMELALETHDPDADEVLDAAEALGDAFDNYDEALFQETGVDTPLDNLDGYDDDDDLDDDEDLDDEDDDLEGDDDDGDDVDEEED